MMRPLRAPQLFVTYSRADANVTEAVCSVLSAAGFRLFVDRKENTHCRW